MSMNLWIIIISVVAFLPGLLYLVGILLPKAYTNQANLLLRHSPDDVWQAISVMNDFRSSSHYSVTTLESDTEFPILFVDMGGTQVTAQTIESDPPHKLVNVLTDATNPVTTTYTYQLEPMGDGTDLTLLEEYYIDHGPWGMPFFKLSVRLARGAGLKLYCQQLTHRLGETAVPIINKKTT